MPSTFHNTKEKKVPNLFRTEEALARSSLEERVRESVNGDIVKIGEVDPRKTQPEKIFPHPRGVLLAVEDDDEFYGWFVNDEQIWPTAELCLPFGDTFVVCNNNGHLLIEGKRKLWKPDKGERVDRVLPHPSGGILVVSGWTIKILKKTSKILRSRYRILRAGEFESLEASWCPSEPEGVVTESKGCFRFNDEKICKNPNFRQKHKFWHPFGKSILAETRRGLTLYNSDNSTNHVHEGKFDKCLSLPWQRSVVVVSDFEFTIYREPFEGGFEKVEIPYNGELIPHPFGVLFRKGREFFILVIK